jgi:hypothetical protein
MEGAAQAAVGVLDELPATQTKKPVNTGLYCLRGLDLNRSE